MGEQVRQRDLAVFVGDGIGGGGGISFVLRSLFLGGLALIFCGGGVDWRGFRGRRE